MKLCKFIFIILIISTILSCTACSISAKKSPQISPKPQQHQAKLKPAPEPKPTKNMRIVGYIPAANVLSEKENYDENIRLLTDAILNTAAYWDASGNITKTDEFDPAMAKIKSLNLTKTKLWCTVNPKGALVRNGTAGESINTKEKRQKLADSLAVFCEENNFAGLDIDWEFPETEKGDWDNFNGLIIAIKKTFEPKKLKLSLALYPEREELSEEAFSSVDYINIMAYDMFDDNGYHSTYESAEKAVNMFLDSGAMPDQLCLGIPFYGRPTDQSAKWPFYRDAQNLAQPSDNLDGNVFYNGTELVGKKTELAKSKNLSGVMLYHIYCDLPADSQNSLIRTVTQALE